MPKNISKIIVQARDSSVQQDGLEQFRDAILAVEEAKERGEIELDSVVMGTFEKKDDGSQEVHIEERKPSSRKEL